MVKSARGGGGVLLLNSAAAAAAAAVGWHNGGLQPLRYPRKEGHHHAQGHDRAASCTPQEGIGTRLAGCCCSSAFQRQHDSCSGCRSRWQQRPRNTVRAPGSFSAGAGAGH